MTTSIQAKAKVFAPDAGAFLVRSWDAELDGSTPSIRLTRKWMVSNCPHCGFPHEHDAGPIQGDPRLALGVVTAGCQKAGGYVDDLARERWKSYNLSEGDSENTDRICKEDAEALGGLISVAEEAPAPTGQEVTCLIY